MGEIRGRISVGIKGTHLVFCLTGLLCLVKLLLCHAHHDQRRPGSSITPSIVPSLKKPADYEAFLRVVDEALEKHPTRILAYCIMGNHWHFVL